MALEKVTALEKVKGLEKVTVPEKGAATSPIARRQ